MKNIGKNERLVANIRTAAFKPFVIDGQEIPGQSFLQFDDTFPAGTGFHIYKMAPGSSSQPHEHSCHEQFLVLEGEVIEYDQKGGIQERATYRNDKLDGERKRFHASGKLREIAPFKEGKPSGPVREYDESGNLKAAAGADGQPGQSKISAFFEKIVKG